MTEDLYYETREAEKYDSLFRIDDVACGFCGDPVHIDRSISVEMPDGYEQWCNQCVIDNMDIVQQCAHCNEHKHIDFMSTNDQCGACYQSQTKPS